MPLEEYSLSTERQGLYDVTDKVAAAVTASGVQEGLAIVFTPHTTSAITINEDADPSVRHDLLLGLDAAFPDQPAFRHGEGNSAAHLKSSCVGASEQVVISGGRLLLGTWQGIYFCEFDGPRKRRFFVKIMEG